MLIFKRLFRKTKELLLTKLRYKLFFWHRVMVSLPLKETHNLDYAAQTWIISQISGVYSHIIYDVKTIRSYNEYLNHDAFFLRIKQMTIDFETFPGTARSHAIEKSEFWRVFLAKYAKVTESFTKKPIYWLDSYGIKYNAVMFIQHCIKKTRLRLLKAPQATAYSKKLDKLAQRLFKRRHKLQYLPKRVVRKNRLRYKARLRKLLLLWNTKINTCFNPIT